MSSEVSAARLLDAWERGISQHPLRRALSLLQLVEPQQSLDALAALSIGERNRRLLHARECLIGSRFESVATCPACGARLELSFTTGQLRDMGEGDAYAVASQQAVTSVEPAVFTVTHDGYTMQVRLPTTADLLDVAAAPADAQNRLLARCVVSVQHDGEQIAAVAALPVEVAATVQARMAEADPMGDLQIALTCPQCGHVWNTALDLAGYVWDEVTERAKRLLRETHILAAAHGWQEADILAMSDRRRQMYLDLIANA